MTAVQSLPPTFQMMPIDLYSDVHKGIRTNIFEVVAAAGRVDPGDRSARIELAARVTDLVEFLVVHALHEDDHMDPSIAEVLPEQSVAIRAEHDALEAEMEHLKALAYVVFDDRRDDGRASTHELYLCLASFASRYLAHQDVEERIVMPRLVEALGVERLAAIHGAILGSIPPEQMAWSLQKMLPAMNIDDRVEMIAGMRMVAPAEAVAGVLALAADVLPEPDYVALVDRLAAGTNGVVEAAA